MRDFELYQTALGLQAPWTVVNVELDVKGQQVTVTVDAGPGPYPCPECQTCVPGYDRKRRRWQHLNTCQFKTWLQTDMPRVSCPTHGVKQIAVPWAEPGSQFTAWFERLALDVLQECSVTGAARLLRVTRDEAWGIKARAVARGLSRRPHDVVAHLGVDEKAIAKRHRYLTIIVADLERSRVLYLAEDRKQESLDGFWPTLTAAQRAGIEAIAMDMWEPYVQSTRAHLAAAETKIVFDKFHVAKHIHDAVDRVRRADHRTLRQDGDARLTGTKYLWLMRPQDMNPEQRATFRALQATDLKVARVWALKERFRQFWDYVYPGAAQTFFARWFWHATHSRLRPMADVAHLIRRHLPNVLTYLTHGLTNAGLETVNATIQWVKKPLAASATSNTSRRRSISIAEARISIQPTPKPEEPSFFSCTGKPRARSENSKLAPSCSSSVK